MSGVLAVFLVDMDIILGNRDIILGNMDIMLGNRDIILGNRDIILGNIDIILGKSLFVFQFVCLSDHNAGTPGPIRLKFIWETREEHGNVLSLVLNFRVE